jgi:hypothetical protein
MIRALGERAFFADQAQAQTIADGRHVGAHQSLCLSMLPAPADP